STRIRRRAPRPASIPPTAAASQIATQRTSPTDRSQASRSSSCTSRRNCCSPTLRATGSWTSCMRATGRSASAATSSPCWRARSSTC
ncbi:hypothetical protein KEM52_001374, partial [Ascosphaera acerosa]